MQVSLYPSTFSLRYPSSILFISPLFPTSFYLFLLLCVLSFLPPSLYPNSSISIISPSFLPSLIHPPLFYYFSLLPSFLPFIQTPLFYGASLSHSFLPFIYPSLFLSFSLLLSLLPFICPPLFLSFLPPSLLSFLYPHSSIFTISPPFPHSFSLSTIIYFSSFSPPLSFGIDIDRQTDRSID